MERPLLSSRATFSHRPGQPCLEGCHEEGGSAELAFAAAGTLYASEDSRTLAKPGKRVFGVAGTTLAVDRCGNFYATREKLPASVRTTQPYVLETTLRKMEKSMNLIAGAGDCNKSGCHDFSKSGTSGIFY
jgi:hypothetical protein